MSIRSLTISFLFILLSSVSFAAENFALTETPNFNDFSCLYKMAGVYQSALPYATLLHIDHQIGGSFKITQHHLLQIMDGSSCPQVSGEILEKKIGSVILKDKDGSSYEQAFYCDGNNFVQRETKYHYGLPRTFGKPDITVQYRIRSLIKGTDGKPQLTDSSKSTEYYIAKAKGWKTSEIDPATVPYMEKLKGSGKVQAFQIVSGDGKNTSVQLAQLPGKPAQVWGYQDVSNAALNDPATILKANGTSDDYDSAWAALKAQPDFVGCKIQKKYKSKTDNVSESAR